MGFYLNKLHFLYFKLKMKLSLFCLALVAMVCIGDALQLPKLFGTALGGEMKNKMMKARKANGVVLPKPMKMMAAKMLFGKMKGCAASCESCPNDVATNVMVCKDKCFAGNFKSQICKTCVMSQADNDGCRNCVKQCVLKQ